MKNIVICCDGTGNFFGKNVSNVVKLHSVIEKTGDRQLAWYDPGVGTLSSYSAFNPLIKKLKFALGQGFGYGIKENILDAYRFLMQHYEEGDHIFLFGFSRGAYTVRAIAGFLYKCGLLQPHNQNLVFEALRIYEGHGTENWKNARSFHYNFARKCPVHFLGLWDTVTSVGWIYDPLVLDSTTRNPSVSVLRHAISIDERRAFFRQNLWHSHNKAPQQDIKQAWFAGVHSDVGGSYAPEDSALSNIALEWMLVEAKRHGLLIRDLKEARKIVSGIEDPQLKNQNKSLSGFWYVAEIWPKLVKKFKPAKASGNSDPDSKPEGKWVSRPYFNLGRPRFLPEDASIHESVWQRLKGRADYRPANLLRDKSPETAEAHFSTEKWERL